MSANRRTEIRRARGIEVERPDNTAEIGKILLDLAKLLNRSAPNLIDASESVNPAKPKSAA